MAGGLDTGQSIDLMTDEESKTKDREKRVRVLDRKRTREYRNGTGRSSLNTNMGNLL